MFRKNLVTLKLYIEYIIFHDLFVSVNYWKLCNLCYSSMQTDIANETKWLFYFKNIFNACYTHKQNTEKCVSLEYSSYHFLMSKNFH